MQFTNTYFLCFMRFDEMEPDENSANKSPIPWAHIYMLEAAKVTDNFAGSAVGKIRIDQSNDNEIAKRIHAKYKNHFPGHFEVDVVLSSKGGEMKPTVVDLRPIQLT